MNELNLNETTLDLFEQYSKQQLPQEGQTEFKNKLDQDPLLHAQYQSYLISKQVINRKIEDSLRDQMIKWKESEVNVGGKVITMPPSQNKIRKVNRSAWAAAASLLIVLSVGFVQYNKNKGFTERMLQEQVALESDAYRAEPSPPSRINIEKIMQGLGEKPSRDVIEKAISELSMGNTLDSNYEQAQLQIGKLYTHLGNWTMAEKAYLNGHAGKSLMERSEILALMKSKQISGKDLQNKLNTLLQDADDENDEILKTIQSKTNSIWWRLFH